MTALDAATLVRLLADGDRRRVVAALVLGADTTDDVVERTSLGLRDVVEALSRLEAAGLVERGADGTLVLLEQAFALAARRELDAMELPDYAYLDELGAAQVFFPRSDFRPPPPGAEDHSIPLPGDVTLGARFYTHDTAAPTVLYFHGNGAWNAYVGSVGALFGGMGYDVYSLDYRGYGESEQQREPEKGARGGHSGLLEGSGQLERPDERLIVPGRPTPGQARPGIRPRHGMISPRLRPRPPPLPTPRIGSTRCSKTSSPS